MEGLGEGRLIPVVHRKNHDDQNLLDKVSMPQRDWRVKVIWHYTLCHLEGRKKPRGYSLLIVPSNCSQ